jgi:hypothetical protein
MVVCMSLIIQLQSDMYVYEHHVQCSLNSAV